MSDPKHKGEHVTETPDVSYIKNVDVTHEVSDVYVSGIAKFVVGLFILTVATFVLMWALFRMFAARTTEPPPPPMALSSEERLPPEPRLQGAPGFGKDLEEKVKPAESEETQPAKSAAPMPKDPQWEIKILRKQWNDVLEHGPVDQNGKRYGMPIEKAKEEILKQGLPVRKTEGSRQ